MEEDLLKFIKNKSDNAEHVSAHYVASCCGIANVYDFLVQHADFRDKVNSDLQAKINNAAEKAREIAAHSNDDAICRKTMEIFLKVCFLLTVSFLVKPTNELLDFSDAGLWCSSKQCCTQVFTFWR